MTVHLPGWHNMFLEGIPFLHTWSRFHRLRACAPFPVPWLMPTSVEWDASCLASLSFNSRLLGLFIPAWEQPGDALAWMMIGIFAYVIAHSRIGIRWLTVYFICSASSPTSSHYSSATSSLTKWDHLCISLPLCIAGADTGTSWCFGSTTVPVTGIGVTPVPIILPSHPEAFFFPSRVLYSPERGSVGLGQAAAHCRGFCLSGISRVAA